jgi:FkbM family methyltransferase
MFRKVIIKWKRSYALRQLSKKFPVSPSGKLTELGFGATWTIPLDLITPSSVCYLVGAGEDISFDLALAHLKKCEVHIFDPTPRALAHYEKLCEGLVHYTRGEEQLRLEPSLRPHFTFHPFGLWSKVDTLKFFAPQNALHVSHSVTNLQKTNTYFEAPVERLSVVMEKLGHKKLALLKIDIEGAEYEVLETIIADKIKISVLCVEFDELFHTPNKVVLKRVETAITRLLAAGFRLVYTSGSGNFTFEENVK